MITVEVAVFGTALDTVRPVATPADWQTWMQTWLTQLAPQLSPIGAYELSLQFTTDAAIAQLNEHYRQQARSTDVLSFAALDDEPLPLEILAEIPFNLGDLVISVETAQCQCQTHAHSLKEELAWLAAHGLLHLLGWDHPDEEQLQAMWAMQRSLLASVDMQLHESAYFAEDPIKFAPI